MTTSCREWHLKLQRKHAIPQSRSSLAFFKICRSPINGRGWHCGWEHCQNTEARCGDFSGTLSPHITHNALICSIFVAVAEKPQNTKSPVNTGLFMVGARGFEPPTPSLPD